MADEVGTQTDDDRRAHESAQADDVHADRVEQAGDERRADRDEQADGARPVEPGDDGATIVSPPDARPATRRQALLALAVVALAIVGVLVWQATRPAPEPPPARLGEAATSGDVTVTARTFECSTVPLPARDAGGSPLSVSGKFCVASLTLHNQGATDLTLHARAQEVTLGDGTVVVGDEAANGPDHLYSDGLVLRAGDDSRAQVAFDVPAGAQVVELRVDPGNGTPVRIAP